MYVCVYVCLYVCKVIEGFEDVFKAIEATPTTSNDKVVCVCV